MILRYSFLFCTCKEVSSVLESSSYPSRLYTCVWKRSAFEDAILLEARQCCALTFAWLCACFAGIIDDVYGANFLQGSTDGNVQDENRHGTFVSGVIGGVANNGQGIAGMNQVRQPVQGQATETY